MLAALIAGERDPKVLAEMDRSSMRRKTNRLEDAFAGLPTGSLDDHDRFLLARMLGRVDQIDADIAAVDAEIEAHLAPFADAASRLDEIPGINATAAAAIIAEIGVDMSRFPTPGHLASWAKFAPGVNSSADRRRATGRPDTTTATWPARSVRPLPVPDEPTPSSAPATDASPDDEQEEGHRRDRQIDLVIIWSVLSDPDATFHDLGADHYDRHTNTARKKQAHIRQLEALGYHVTLEPAA